MPMNPRLLRPLASRAVAFDPRLITGCTAWLDAANSSTITLNGSTVSEWRNLGSAAGAYSQATAAQQPSTTTINGRTAIAFTPGRVALVGGPLASALSGGGGTVMSLFVVMRINAVGSITRTFGVAGSGGNFGIYASLNGNVLWDTPDSTARVSGGAPAVGATSVQRFVRNGATASIHRNGSSLASRADASNVIPGSATVWGHDQVANTMNVDVAEVVVYNQTPSAAEISAIERYLGFKWGVTVA